MTGGFENLPNLSYNKTQIIYHSIDPIKKNTKKNKQIIFVGKLNENKGYDIFVETAEKFKKINNNHKSAHIRSIWYYSVFFPIVEILSAISIGLLIYSDIAIGTSKYHLLLEPW